MTPERWKEVRAILDRALDQAPEERAAFLERACAGDDALRTSVQGLLDAHERADTLFDEADGRIVLPVGGDGAPDAPERIGPYRIVEEIGRGGMGVVYRAERADGAYEQQVALKVVRPGLGAPEVLRRFRAERQILASLDHPNIARLLDGGLTDSGQPYFVMEYARGTPLTDYCDRHALPIEQRLALFRTVCAAVHHAHRRLVVHRDLKPSNILVKEEGAGRARRAVPLLLDFGVAKLLDPAQAGPVTLVETQTGRQLLTPAYAAPEQVTGAPVTTATDVYALGVLLYELLAGRRPYRLDGRTRREVERIICEEAPEKPSTAATSVETVEHADGTTETISPETVSRTRQTGPGRLRKTLSGDLDTIVLKALRKEPERRYASAEALADDLGRYLKGRTVTARPDTLGYRAGKFVRRNRWGVAVAALIVVLVVGYAATATMQAQRITEERDRARTEAAKAEQVTAFLLSLFEASTPDRAQGDTVTAAMLLRQGRRRAEALRSQPAVQARMLDVMGQVYLSLGRYQEADSLFRRALVLHRRLHGTTGERALATLNHLANLRYRQGEYSTADSLFQEVLRRSRQAGLDAQTAITLNDLGNVAQLQSNFEEAERYHRKALALRRTLYGNEHEGVAASLNNIGLALRGQDRLEAAESFYRRALALHRRLYGDMHTETTLTMRNLGQVLIDMVRYEEADSLLRRVLVVDRQLLDRNHPRISKDLNELATLTAKREDYAAAEHLFREALAIQRARLGDDHPRIAMSLNNLAYVLGERGKPDDALVLKREALAVARRSLGNDHVSTALYAHNLATSLHEAGKLEVAAPLYQEAIRTLRRNLSVEHRLLSYPLIELGKLHVEQGHPQEARPLLEEGLSISRHAWPADHVNVADAREALGACLADLGHWERAEQLLLQAYQTMKTRRGLTHEDAQAAVRHLITLYDAWGKPGEAARYRDTLTVAEWAAR